MQNETEIKENTKNSKSLGDLVEVLNKNQHESGYFYTVIKQSNLKVERIMATSLTTKALCYILLKYGWHEDIACIVEKSINYLIETASKVQKWQWNYYPNHISSPYPDDYDDTAISVEAILLWELARLTYIQDSQDFKGEIKNNELIESLRNRWRLSLIMHFSSFTIKEGKPEKKSNKQNKYENPLITGYPTWITSFTPETQSWLENIDPVVNAHIANVCLLLGLHNYLPKTYIKNTFEKFRDSKYSNSRSGLNSEYYISTLPYLHSLIFLSSHKIDGEKLFNLDDVLIIEKLFQEELNMCSPNSALYIEGVKQVRNKKNLEVETEYATCPAYIEALFALYLH